MSGSISTGTLETPAWRSVGTELEDGDEARVVGEAGRRLAARIGDVEDPHALPGVADVEELAPRVDGDGEGASLRVEATDDAASTPARRRRRPRRRSRRPRRRRGPAESGSPDGSAGHCTEQAPAFRGRVIPVATAMPTALAAPTPARLSGRCPRSPATCCSRILSRPAPGRARARRSTLKATRPYPLSAPTTRNSSSGTFSRDDDGVGEGDEARDGLKAQAVVSRTAARRAARRSVRWRCSAGRRRTSKAGRGGRPRSSCRRRRGGASPSGPDRSERAPRSLPARRRPRGRRRRDRSRGRRRRRWRRCRARARGGRRGRRAGARARRGHPARRAALVDSPVVTFVSFTIRGRAGSGPAGTTPARS